MFLKIVNLMEIALELEQDAYIQETLITSRLKGTLYDNVANENVLRYLCNSLRLWGSKIMGPWWSLHSISALQQIDT